MQSGRPSTRPSAWGNRLRAGVTLSEVLVLVAIVGLVVLIVLTSLPRQREQARNVACQRNLAQIGRAIVLVDHQSGHLPGVSALGEDVPGPLATMLEALGQEDLAAIGPNRKMPARRGNVPKGARMVAGFVCPSDPNANGGLFDAPVNYRATTGSKPDGRDGAFAPGRRLSLADVEAADGLSFTVGFSERLVGDGKPAEALPNYRVEPGGPWKGDAGSSWLEATWRSSLENHAIRPQGTPSEISKDGKTARMGASSDHAGHVFVLTLDGAVRPVSTGIDPAVWKAFARIDDGSKSKK